MVTTINGAPKPKTYIIETNDAASFGGDNFLGLENMGSGAPLAKTFIAETSAEIVLWDRNVNVLKRKVRLRDVIIGYLSLKMTYPSAPPCLPGPLNQRNFVSVLQQRTIVYIRFLQTELYSTFNSAVHTPHSSC